MIDSTSITLDGVISQPSWPGPCFDKSAAAFAGMQTERADAVLMGRVTHKGIARPARGDDIAYGAACINSMKKYVAPPPR